MPLIADRIKDEGLKGSVKKDGETVSIDYAAMATGTGYIRSNVLLEFGARSTGEPAERHEITCDAASALGEIEFPLQNHVSCGLKVTAIHVYCKRGEFRAADRYARHWYDVVCLDREGISAAALADRGLGEQRRSDRFVRVSRSLSFHRRAGHLGPGVHQ